MSRNSAEREFWRWFLEHEAELFSFDPGNEPERERLFDGLADVLRKVDQDLVFEFGPKESVREFVISAGGTKRAFPAVVSVVREAPTLKRWNLIAFRPRRAPSTVEFRGKRVDPSQVRFTLLDNGKIAGVRLFLPGFQERDPDLRQVGYLLLDNALGEYDVETRLGLIEIRALESSKEYRHPFSELPGLFDSLVNKLEGRSGRVS